MKSQNNLHLMNNLIQKDWNQNSLMLDTYYLKLLRFSLKFKHLQMRLSFSLFENLLVPFTLYQNHLNFLFLNSHIHFCQKFENIVFLNLVVIRSISTILSSLFPDAYYPNFLIFIYSNDLNLIKNTFSINR